MQNEKTNKNNEAWIVSRKKFILEIAVIIISAILYGCAFPPLNWSFCAWFAITPLYLVIAKKSPVKAFLWGLLWGYIWAVISFFWLREIEFFIPYAAAFLLGLFPACWALFLPFFRRNILIPVDIQLKGSEEEESYKPKYLREVLFIFSITSLWCLTEWVRSWIATGLPWNFTGSSQWRNISLIQVCEYTGIYGISFIIIFFNIALAFTLVAIRKAVNGEKYRRPIPFIISLVFLITAILSGAKSMLKYNIAVRDEKNKDKNKYVSFNASVIQGDIPQCRFPKGGEAENALYQYLKLSKVALQIDPDIVIWPETAVPYCYRSRMKFGDLYRFEIFKLLQSGKTPLLFGTVDYDFELLELGTPPEQIPSHNSAFFLHHKSANQFNIVDKYHKIHLVPWGEYTPLGKYIPAIKKAFGMGRDLSPGKRFTIFELKPGIKAGVNICYEDVFSEISANFARSGANLLLVLTNDAWYPESSEAEQHLANAVFRTVETRLPMIRAGNSSCSCLILPNGKILETSKFFSKEEKNMETLLLENKEFEILSLNNDNVEKVFHYINSKDNDIWVQINDEIYKVTSLRDPTVQQRGFASFKIDVMKKPELTFYTKYPYLFIWLCSLSVLLAFLYSIWSWREKKKFYLDKFNKD